MQALATPDDVADSIQRELTPVERIAVSSALDYASGAIRSWARQTITQVEDDVALLYGNWSPVLYLPEQPVTAVGAVEVNGTALTVDEDFVWRGKGELLRGPASRVVRHPLDWGGGHAVVSVTYTHGYTVVPDELIGVCVGMVHRYATNPDGVAGETIGSYSVQFRDSTPSAYVLTDEDRAIVGTYRQGAR